MNPRRSEFCNNAVSDEKLTSDQLLKLAAHEPRRLIVTGLAGSGKSVFMKHSFRQSLEAGLTYYPIFFEFRKLNLQSISQGSVLDAVYDSIAEACPEYPRIQFNYALEQGAFFFLFDGFDELSHTNRDKGAEEILRLSRTFPKCPIIVSSRPSDEFISWEGFHQAQLLPFDLEQVIEYLQKIRFDEDRKQEFIDAVKAGLYSEKREFLSNPLLAAMMLLTFDSFGEIPAQIHIFYQKCFDVLAREHDTSKGRYTREFFSGLELKELERAFMFFCAHSYADRAFSFDLAAMRDYTRRAALSCAATPDIDLLIRDFRESLSIMQLDGLQYEFAHRSFQEFFYAKFVVEDRELTLNQKVDWLANTFAFDNAISMIYDINKAYFEDDYLIPELAAAIQKLSRNIKSGKLHLAILMFYSGVTARHTHLREDNTSSPDVVPRLGFVVSNAKNHLLWRIVLRADAKDHPEQHEMWRAAREQWTATCLAEMETRRMESLDFSLKQVDVMRELGFAEFAQDRLEKLRAYYRELLARKETRSKSISSLISDRYLTQPKTRTGRPN